MGGGVQNKKSVIFLKFVYIVPLKNNFFYVIKVIFLRWTPRC